MLPLLTPVRTSPISVAPPPPLTCDSFALLATSWISDPEGNMAATNDLQAKMLAAIGRLTIAVEKQPAHIETLNSNQIAPPSALETMQRRLAAVQEASAQHQVDVAAQFKATQERSEARLARAPGQAEAPRSHPRGATDEGMGVATPTAPTLAPSSPRPPPPASTRLSSTGRPA